ncbi:tpx protein [Mycobacterium tuberculosis T85]|nr:tpx protein [Mycobacterium tuberculosis T85]
MAQITLRGNAINTVGELPAVGSPAPAFTLTGGDLGVISSDQFRGKSVLLNIFPSVDTPVCATSVRTFDERAAASGATVLCVSKDLPFAQKRFCGAEGTENVMPASAFRDSFGEDYGVTIADGPMAGLLARAIVVIGADGNVAYTELVPEIAQNPTTKRRWARWAPRLSQPRAFGEQRTISSAAPESASVVLARRNTGAGRAPT